MTPCSITTRKIFHAGGSVRRAEWSEKIGGLRRHGHLHISVHLPDDARRLVKVRSEMLPLVTDRLGAARSILRMKTHPGRSRRIAWQKLRTTTSLR